MKKAIVLGGTLPHIDLIKKLKKRGYFVVLIDYLQNPPCAVYADKHIKESTLDKDLVLSIAKSENAELIISACIDQANCTCAYVAEKLELPTPYSYEVSLDVTDKGRMKKIFCECDIPTSKYIVVNSVDEIDWNAVSYPAVVKPVDCNSSKGVHRANNREELSVFVAEDIGFSRSGQAIIEGFNIGEEIQVDCIAEKDGSATVLLTRQKKRVFGKDGEVLQSIGSYVPAQITDCFQNDVSVIAQKIADAFHLRNTPFFYQAIVTDKGISVLEFAPRIGGGLSSYLLDEVCGIDAVEMVIDSFLGKEIRVQIKPNLNQYTTCLLYMRPGLFMGISGVEELKKDGVICDAFVYKKEGTFIDSDLRSGNRVGALVIKGNSYSDLLNKEKIAIERITVSNENGENALIKDR